MQCQRTGYEYHSEKQAKEETRKTKQSTQKNKKTPRLLE